MPLGVGRVDRQRSTPAMSWYWAPVSVVFRYALPSMAISSPDRLRKPGRRRSRAPRNSPCRCRPRRSSRSGRPVRWPPPIGSATAPCHRRRRRAWTVLAASLEVSAAVMTALASGQGGGALGAAPARSQRRRRAGDARARVAGCGGSWGSSGSRAADARRPCDGSRDRVGVTAASAVKRPRAASVHLGDNRRGRTRHGRQRDRHRPDRYLRLRPDLRPRRVRDVDRARHRPAAEHGGPHHDAGRASRASARRARSGARTCRRSVRARAPRCASWRRRSSGSTRRTSRPSTPDGCDAARPRIREERASMSRAGTSSGGSPASRSRCCSVACCRTRLPLYVAVPLGEPAEMQAFVERERDGGIHRFQLKLGGDPRTDQRSRGGGPRRHRPGGRDHRRRQRRMATAGRDRRGTAARADSTGSASSNRARRSRRA